MKENIILALKGFLIGLANIIPGVSGGTMMVSFGLYERLIGIASNLTKDIKKNIKFILPILIGAFVSIAFFSNIITICLDKYKVATPLLFTGLIMGGVPIIYKKTSKKLNISSIIAFTLTIIFMALIYLLLNKSSNVSFSNMQFTNYILLFIIGIVAAATMVIPGISGSFVLMLIGYYEPIVNVISDLTKFNNIFSNILILAPFGIGVLFGIISIAKLIKYLLKRFEVQTYSAILGFVISSGILIVSSLFGLSCSTIELVIGIILLIVGTLVTYKMES